MKIVAKSVLLCFRLIDQTTEQLLFFTELVPPNRDATERRGDCGGFQSAKGGSQNLGGVERNGSKPPNIKIVIESRSG